MDDVHSLVIGLATETPQQRQVRAHGVLITKSWASALTATSRRVERAANMSFESVDGGGGEQRAGAGRNFLRDMSLRDIVTFEELHNPEN